MNIEHQNLKESIALRQEEEDINESSIANLRADIESVRVSLMNKPKMLSDQRANKLQCKKCGETFYSHNNLKFYINFKHPKSVKCKECGLKFDENWKLEKHIGLKLK